MQKVLAVDIGSITPGINQFATWGSLVNVILRNALVIAGVIAFILLIVAGFQFIVGAGSGDSKRFEQTRTTILIVVIGLIVVAISVWLVQIVEKITGLNLISP